MLFLLVESVFQNIIFLNFHPLTQFLISKYIALKIPLNILNQVIIFLRNIVNCTRMRMGEVVEFPSHILIHVTSKMPKYAAYCF